MCSHFLQAKILSWLTYCKNPVKAAVTFSLSLIFLSSAIVLAESESSVPDKFSAREKAAMENTFSVTDAWIKLSPPGAAVNAAYMKLHNQATEEKVIVAVTADCCTQVMMHQTRREGDKVYMDHKDTLYIPAGGELQLAPGGLHLMLVGAKNPMTLGDSVDIHFDFSDSTQFTISVPVKKAADDH